MSDDAQEWRWVSEDGVENAVTEQELIAELSAEGLPPYTLVWKEGWLEWLPAMRVAELAWALPPGKAERAMKPRENATGAQPPSPPLYLYPVLKRRSSLPVDDAGVEDVGRSNPVAAAKLEPRRAPSPDSEVTLVADGGLVDSDPSFEHVGPGKAVLGTRAYSEEDDGDTHIVPSRPPPRGAVYVGPHAPPQSERPAPAYEEEEIPVIPRPPPPPSDLSNYTRFSPNSDVELEQPIPKTRAPLRNVALAGAAAALGIGAAVLVLYGLRSGGGPAEDASAAQAGATAPARQPSGRVATTVAEAPLHGAPCAIVTPAMRLADWAEPSVPPLFASVPGSTRIAVGYAQSETYAVGLTIDPRTLDRDQVFREFRREKLVSVVPTTGSGKLHFEIIRQGYALANARAVDGPSPFVLGATPYAIARRQKDQPIQLWALTDADQSTVPRVAPTTRGYAVAIRRAGKNGAIAVGYLDEEGNKKTELGELRADAVATGTPALAASDKSLVVAFAARTSSTAPWSIAAGIAGLSELPRKATILPLRGGGPGGDRVAAAVGALGGGRWLVQWSEGSTGGSRVARAEVLDEKLAPFAEATDVSPAGANAGQGVVWTSGDLATILFFVKNEKGNALWGVSLECPRAN